jgi:uncharacterized protein
MPSAQAIFAAIDTSDISDVKRILDDDPGLICARNFGRNTDGTLQRASDSPTPLQTAAMLGHLQIVKLLIDRGAGIYETAQWGYPAVEHALWKGQQHVVDFLLGEAAAHPSVAGAPTYGLGCDVNLAARNGWLDLVKKHLDKDRLAVHRRGVIGETPVHWAAHNGQVEIVRALLDAGADIEADEIGCYGGKPLHWASEHAPQVVKLLLERGAAVNGRNVKPGAEYEGVTPLIMVATQANDCAECAELLIAAGADLHATDTKGRSALTWAVAKGAKRVEAVLRSSREA